MPSSEFKYWVDDAFTTLAKSDEVFFSQLWGKKRLSYDGSSELIDIIDESNSKLICTALDKRLPLLNVLPDYEAHRGALIFGTALLRSSVKCIQDQEENHTVLYYGTSAGFKHSLAYTTVQGTHLDSVFGTNQMTGKYKRQGRDEGIDSEYLPEVICIYHPAEPEQYVQIYQPDWVAIDCGKEGEVKWLENLLNYCRKKIIPVVGWCQNNFSSVITEFEKNGGYVFYSPKRKLKSVVNRYADLISNDETRIIIPTVFAGKDADEIDDLLQKAKSVLRGMKGYNNTPVKRDGIRATWRYLRQLEKLTLPLKIYNSEAKAFWNTYPLYEVKEGVERYVNAVEKLDSQLASRLEKCLTILDQIYSMFENKEPPYWTVLSNYCIDRSPEGTIRVILFPSRSQKRLFSYTLLSRFNISEKELLDYSKVILRTIKEFSSPNIFDHQLLKSQEVDPIFIGLPDHYNSPLFYQAINKFNIKVLLYPHQLGVLKTIISSYCEKEIKQFETAITTLGVMTDKTACCETPTPAQRYELSKSFPELEIDLADNISVKERKSEGGIEIGDLHTELAKLLETSKEDEDIGHLVSISIETEPSSKSTDNNSFLVEGAIALYLEEGFRLLIDRNERINVVNENEVVKVFSRAVSIGDLILCIQNQARMDLFDLLIDRIHNHKALSIHLSLLQKWREEFYLSYMIWKDNNSESGLWEFWQLLREKGSTVETHVTVGNWLHGHTIRPQDTVNILRVGQVLDNEFIKDNYKEIANAASRIVGLHISLSRKLKKWLEGKTYDFRRDDLTIVDEELGLSLGELRSSIKVLRIKRIEEVDGLILRNTIGVLHKQA